MELEHDLDRDFLLQGIKEGFRISDVDDVSEIDSVHCPNHPSIDTHHDLVERELKAQVEVGNYVCSSNKPLIISPMGAILKEGRDEVRLIHDGSRPTATESMNSYSLPTSVQYESIENAYKLAMPNTYLCKIDLKAAYRSVAIHPSDYPLTGLQFRFSADKSATNMFDTRLPFGSSKGPMIFHRLSQAVKRMMQRRGYHNMVVYLDDFLCVESSYEKCCEVQNVLLSLLIRLGFQISWKKVMGPNQSLEFLGVIIDTTQCTASLSEVKVCNLQTKLQSFKEKKRATKRQLQSLAGSLNWACQAIRGGRFFLRRILDTVNKLKYASHKCKLSSDFKNDLKWWLQFLAKFNGTVYYRDVCKITCHTDACQEGAGMFCHGHWHYINWKQDMPKASNLHINYKEVLAIVWAVKIWACHWKNCDITIVTDSTVAKAIINKGRCKNGYVMGWLRHMFWVMVTFNIRVRAIHIPGSLNQIPDAVSRLHEDGQALRLCSLLNLWHHGRSSVSFYDMCRASMSTKAFQILHPHLIKWWSILR